LRFHNFVSFVGASISNSMADLINQLT